jgi:rhodanese-related sulfurtransferase
VTRKTVDELLADARSRLDRLDPEQARDAVGAGALIVDIRSQPQRDHDGVVPGAIYHPRNVLEWRADPSSGASDPAIARDLERQVIVMCDAGYASSFAAATLQDLGFERATDLAGGFQAWRAAGLPVEDAPDAPN